MVKFDIKNSAKGGLYLAILLICKTFVADAQQHPRILVKPGDRKTIVNKIRNSAWADSIYSDFKSTLRPLVKRHQHDSDWILSRYLMNWKKDGHYTDFQSDPAGARLVAQSGNAPIPTVRVTTHKRPPVTKDGYGFRAPTLKELTPYDTSHTMHLQSLGPDHHWERVDPRSMIDRINGKINTLALESGILYWLSGKEKYAKFSADILMQWARGAVYQHPIEGSLRDGYFCMQTLGDYSYASLALTYDFVYPYLIKKGKNTSVVNTVLKRMAQTQIKRGFTHNNWFAAEMPTLVWSALALDDAQTRKQLMAYYMNKDYEVHKGYGQWSVKKALATFIDPHGHWEEAPGYHNYPIRRLYEAALAAENNHYNVFGKYPRLLKSASVMYDYSFPNGKAMAFGDNHHRARQSPELLEIGWMMGQKYHSGVADTLSFILEKLIKKGDYKQKNAGYLGLLDFKPIGEKQTITSLKRPRTAKLNYAHCYLQRNEGKDYDLMSYVQGATYNHNHANGMAMELYGEGYVMGADPGADISYSTPKHGAYYIQAGAHNTVVPAPQLPRITPFSMGPRGIGHITLDSMEPEPGHKAVSPFYSYSTTSYVDTTTRILTHQRRTMAVVRTSDHSGYYVDIYRSDNPLENDYVYHNIGRSLKFYDESGQAISLQTAHDFQNDFGRQGAGFQFFKNQKVIKNYEGGLHARFSLYGTDTLSSKKGIYMNIFMPADTVRSYYKALAPRTHTAPLPYNRWPTPTLIIRQKGMAWNHPFVAIYQPADGKTGMHIEKVQKLDTGKENAESVSLQLTSKKGDITQRDYIFNESNGKVLKVKEDIFFDGDFGIARLRNHHLHSLYLGKGHQISKGAYQIEAVDNNNISANLMLDNGHRMISSNKPVYVTLPFESNKDSPAVEGIHVSYQEKNGQSKRVHFDLLPSDVGQPRIRLKLPVVQNATIQVYYDN